MFHKLVYKMRIKKKRTKSTTNCAVELFIIVELKKTQKANTYVFEIKDYLRIIEIFNQQMKQITMYVMCNGIRENKEKREEKEGEKSRFNGRRQVEEERHDVEGPQPPSHFSVSLL